MENPTKEEIYAALQTYIGLPLTDMWRPAYQVFEFGEQKPRGLNERGQEYWSADLQMDVSGPWRILHNGRILFGREDYRQREFLSGHPTAASKATEEFFDKVEEGKLVCLSVTIPFGADIRIELSEDYVIQSFASFKSWQTILLRNNSAGPSIFVDKESLA
ncbi:MAG TPA: hypothetical protein VGL56_12930 [Fimbriimonadaceae bacterium]|jgi:hypothetical protein